MSASRPFRVLVTRAEPGAAATARARAAKGMRVTSALMGALALAGCAGFLQQRPATSADSVEVLLTKVCLPYVIDGLSESEAVADRGFRNFPEDFFRLVDPAPRGDGSLYATQYPGIQEFGIQPRSRTCHISLKPEVTPEAASAGVEAALRARRETWEAMGSNGVQCAKGSDTVLLLNRGKNYGGVEQSYIIVSLHSDKCQRGAKA